MVYRRLLINEDDLVSVVEECMVRSSIPVRARDFPILHNALHSSWSLPAVWGCPFGAMYTPASLPFWTSPA